MNEHEQPTLTRNDYCFSFHRRHDHSLNVACWWCPKGTTETVLKWMRLRICEVKDFQDLTKNFAGKRRVAYADARAVFECHLCPKTESNHSNYVNKKIMLSLYRERTT